MSGGDAASVSRGQAPPLENGAAGCPDDAVKTKLRAAGLRPTRQRVALGKILFADGDRHITADALHYEANRGETRVSLATVYNALHQFTHAGLLRQVAIDVSKSFFDTNNAAHHHFFIEGANELRDIPLSDVAVSKIPVAPAGYEIERIDVLFRLRKPAWQQDDGHTADGAYRSFWRGA